jgi:hypothetical protein
MSDHYSDCETKEEAAATARRFAFMSRNPSGQYDLGTKKKENNVTKKAQQQMDLPIGSNSPPTTYGFGVPVEIDKNRFLMFAELPDGSLTIEAFMRDKNETVFRSQRIRFTREAVTKLVDVCSWWLGRPPASKVKAESKKVENNFYKFLPGIYRALKDLTTEVKEGNMALAENVTTLITTSQIRSPMDDMGPAKPSKRTSVKNRTKKQGDKVKELVEDMYGPLTNLSKEKGR